MSSSDQSGKKDAQIYMTLVTGNLYKIEKKKVTIGTLKNLKPQVNISAEQTTVSNTKQ